MNKNLLDAIEDNLPKPQAEDEFTISQIENKIRERGYRIGRTHGVIEFLRSKGFVISERDIIAINGKTCKAYKLESIPEPESAPKAQEGK